MFLLRLTPPLTQPHSPCPHKHTHTTASTRMHACASMHMYTHTPRGQQEERDVCRGRTRAHLVLIVVEAGQARRVGHQHHVAQVGQAFDHRQHRLVCSAADGGLHVRDVAAGGQGSRRTHHMQPTGPDAGANPAHTCRARVGTQSACTHQVLIHLKKQAMASVCKRVRTCA